MRPLAILALLLVLVSVASAADRGTWEGLEASFHQPTQADRQLTGPLFWLHGDESEARLRFYVDRVAEGGNGCFTVESRPHDDWLGPGWWRDLAICLDQAKRDGLGMWIFDEKWFPSGEVAYQVPEQYGSKRLANTVTDVTGPTHVSLPVADTGHLVAVIAGRVAEGGLEGASLVDLTPGVSQGKVEWDAPEGQWQVVTVTWAPYKSGPRYLIDGASKDVVDWYLKTVYQPHYDHFAADFGKTIKGFFYDEPETHGDWGTEVFPVLSERGVDWKRPLMAWTVGLAGEEQTAARFAYQSALAEAWGRTLYGGITRWCEERGVRSIGHWLEHGGLYVNQWLCAGDVFPLMKYTSMGGIDAVFSQLRWGQRVAYDAPMWQIPKLGSSVTHAYGKPDDVTMIEIFGARGQDLTYPEMKWWTDAVQVAGVNFTIPHSFNPRAPYDNDCPPFFYNGGYEPRWPLYRVWADYTTRLSTMLTGGRHVCPVALLSPGQSAQLGRTVLPDTMSELLQDALYDCDWIPYEVFAGDMTIDGGDLRLREESYRVLILPATEVVPYEILVKAREFFESGGIVLAYGILPSRSATLGHGSADVAELTRAIWGEAQPGLALSKESAASGRSYFLPEAPTPEQLQQVLAGDAGVHSTLEVLEGDTNHWLHVLHRQRLGRDLFFVTNQDHLSAARTFRLRATAEGYPECWDAMRDEITVPSYSREGATCDLELTLEPNESVLLVFQPTKRALPPRGEPADRAGAVVIPATRIEMPPPPEKRPEGASMVARALGECQWIWHPGDDPNAVAPCTRYFRRVVTLPAEAPVSATYIGATDNAFTLYVNGQEAGSAGDDANGWRTPVELDVAALLHGGENVLALAARNAGAAPNPAGAIGRLVVEYAQGAPVIVPLDETWRACDSEQAGWTGAGFDDSAWPMAKVVCAYGGGPWGAFAAGKLTLSPAKADPFLGYAELPAALPEGSRVYLEMTDLAPEVAASVSIDGHYAGGCIGLPLRLEITRFCHPGRHQIRIEPFAPKSVRVVVAPPPMH